MDFITIILYDLDCRRVNKTYVKTNDRYKIAACGKAVAQHASKYKGIETVPNYKHAADVDLIIKLAALLLDMNTYDTIRVEVHAEDKEILRFNHKTSTLVSNYITRLTSATHIGADYQRFNLCNVLLCEITKSRPDYVNEDKKQSAIFKTYVKLLKERRSKNESTT